MKVYELIERLQKVPQDYEIKNGLGDREHIVIDKEKSIVAIVSNEIMHIITIRYKNESI